MKPIAVLICRLLAFIGKLFGKGTSLPGAVVLKLFPDILSRITFSSPVIAVTGSNGKTSTVEMIAHIFAASGKKVIFNKEGSNQIEGVTTLLLKNCTLSGKVKGDIVLLESDERYARHTFKHIKPTHFVVTNLYRDQLTRNAHPFYIYDLLKDAVDLIPHAALLLNADDPIVRQFGLGRENTVYFGMERNRYSEEVSTALYNDCCYCPVCKERLDYSYFHYAHLGNYSCTGCSYKRPDTAFTVEDIDLENNSMTVNGNKIELAFSSRYNIYNLASAYAAAVTAGIDGKTAAAALSDFVMKNGRVVKFTAGENEGLLLTSKHENSTSYNMSLEYVVRQKEQSELIIIVDEISRKYYTSETGWLWDISFGQLKDSSVIRIILTGSYAYDLALRFELTDIDSNIIVTEPDIDKAVALISEPFDGKLFAITCFSDKDKLYSRVKVQSPTAK